MSSARNKIKENRFILSMIAIEKKIKAFNEVRWQENPTFEKQEAIDQRWREIDALIVELKEQAKAFKDNSDYHEEFIKHLENLSYAPKPLEENSVTLSAVQLHVKKENSMTSVGEMGVFKNEETQEPDKSASTSTSVNKKPIV